MSSIMACMNGLYTANVWYYRVKTVQTAGVHLRESTEGCVHERACACACACACVLMVVETG